MLPGIIPITLIAAALLAAAGTAFTQVPTSAPRRRSELQRALPITKFYDTPHPLPPGKPGELIRSQSFEQYELPFSVDAFRILYHSRSATGEDVAASGVVLIPSERKPPSGGWPVIAWAHGTSGVARRCAPSLARNLGHGPFLSMYVNLGYAVVAADYTGLGTDFRNAFLDGPSNATDIIASISAAHAAVPQLGTKWIVMGAAEGTLAAVAVAEKENEIRDPGYLGSIAISGLADGKEWYRPSAPGSSGPGSSGAGSSGAGSSSLMLASLAFGIKTVYPQFQVADMLTENGLALERQVEETCWEAEASGVLPIAEVVKPGWDDNGFVRQYFARNRLAQTRAQGPIMVISSDSDQAIPETLTAQTIARMCKQGERVQWQRYSNLDPGRVIGDSVRDQISWIEDRFAGRSSTTTCP